MLECSVFPVDLTGVAVLLALGLVADLFDFSTLPLLPADLADLLLLDLPPPLLCFDEELLLLVSFVDFFDMESPGRCGVVVVRDLEDVDRK